MSHVSFTTIWCGGFSVVVVLVGVATLIFTYFQHTWGCLVQLLLATAAFTPIENKALLQSASVHSCSTLTSQGGGKSAFM